jgi:hypothetical protein
MRLYGIIRFTRVVTPVFSRFNFLQTHYNENREGAPSFEVLGIGGEAIAALMSFNEVLRAQTGDKTKFLVQVDKDMYRGVPQMKMMGVDYLL